MRGIWLLWLAALTFSAYAAPQKEARKENGAFFTYGVGNNSCGQFVAASKAGAQDSVVTAQGNGARYLSEHGIYITWASGFLTAYNAFNPQKINLTGLDRDGLTLWLQNWCSAHPLDSFVAAVYALILERS